MDVVRLFDFEDADWEYVGNTPTEDTAPQADADAEAEAEAADFEEPEVKTDDQV